MNMNNICTICYSDNSWGIDVCRSCGRTISKTETFAPVIVSQVSQNSFLDEDAKPSSGKDKGGIARRTCFMSPSEFSRPNEAVTPTPERTIPQRSSGSIKQGHRNEATSRHSGTSGVSTGNNSTSGRRRETSVDLEVIRGEILGMHYQVIPGRNIVGRSADVPVDIDLTGQEPLERVWSSRLHAVIHFDGTRVWIEDTKSLNGTIVNNTKLLPCIQQVLENNDIIQLGLLRLRVNISVCIYG